MLLPCFMFRSTSLHAYMFRSTCFRFYAMFSYVLCLFLSYVDVRVTCSHVRLGVCNQPAKPPKPIQPNLTRRVGSIFRARWVGSIFRAWWVGLGYKFFFFDNDLGWVRVIKFQTRQTQPDLPIYLIHI